MTSQTTAVHHLLQSISVLAIAIQLSKTSCWLGEREARRLLCDLTPSSSACQDPAVSHLRFLLLVCCLRTAQARSHSGVYHSLGSLSRPCGISFCSISFHIRQPLRLPHIQESTTTRNRCQDLAVSHLAVPRFCLCRLENPRRVPASTLGSYHNLERLSRPRSLPFSSITFSVRRLWKPRRFPASTPRAYHNLERLSSPCSITFPFIRERRNYSVFKEHLRFRARSPFPAWDL